MTRDDDERRAELIAGAIAGSLSAREQRDLAQLVARDPEIERELSGLGHTAEAVGAVGGWVDAAPTDELRARIAAIPSASTASEQSRDLPAGDTPTTPESASTLRPGRRARAPWFVPLTAAACLVVGLGIGLAVPFDLSSPPVGPPGTLGAIEHTDVSVEVDGVDLDVDLVAHTWGTEAVIDATGLAEGKTYSVVVVGLRGEEFSAGEMLGSAVPIHCSLNAAVLREDVAGIEIRDAGGQRVAGADVPPV